MTKLMVGYSVVGTGAMFMAIYCFATGHPVLGGINSCLVIANLVGLSRQ